MNLRAVTISLATLVLATALPVTASADSDAAQWLERMSAAMSQMTYQGTFVYVQGDAVETMRITHVSDEEGVREHLVSISGLRREILRDANGVPIVLGNKFTFVDFKDRDSYTWKIYASSPNIRFPMCPRTA